MSFFIDFSVISFYLFFIILFPFSSNFSPTNKYLLGWIKIKSFFAPQLFNFCSKSGRRFYKHQEIDFLFFPVSWEVREDFIFINLGKTFEKSENSWKKSRKILGKVRKKSKKIQKKILKNFEKSEKKTQILNQNKTENSGKIN